MTPALRWAAIKNMNESQLNFSLIVRNKATRQCPQTNLFRRERRAEADSNRAPSAYQPNALPPGQTGSRCGTERQRKLKPVLNWAKCLWALSTMFTYLRGRMGGGHLTPAGSVVHSVLTLSTLRQVSSEVGSDGVDPSLQITLRMSPSQ